MRNEYEVRGDETVIFLNYRGTILETVIDTCDLELANSISGLWSARATRSNANKFYVYGYDKRIKNPISLARMLMGFPDGLVVDHINDDSLNNRRSTNLQAITSIENLKKQPKRNGPRKPYMTVKRKLNSLGIPCGW